MILYHGTKNYFDTFSLDYLRTNGTSEGLGIYLTDSKQVAKSYAFDNGYTLTVEFNGKKPLSSTELTLSKDEIREYILEIHQETGLLNDINDISYYGFNKVLEEALEMFFSNESDTDLISEVGNTVGDLKTALDIIYTKFGYDHAVVDATWGYELGQKYIYTVFTPDVLEILKREEYQE